MNVFRTVPCPICPRDPESQTHGGWTIKLENGAVLKLCDHGSISLVGQSPDVRKVPAS